MNQDDSAVDGFFPEPRRSSLRQTINTKGLSEEDALNIVLGTTEFRTTKGKQVRGNELKKSAYVKTRKPRQVLKQKSNYQIPLTKQEQEAQQMKQ